MRLKVGLPGRLGAHAEQWAPLAEEPSGVLSQRRSKERRTEAAMHHARRSCISASGRGTGRIQGKGLEYKLFAARSAESSRLKMGPRCKGEPGGVATPLATNDHRIAVTALIEAIEAYSARKNSWS